MRIFKYHIIILTICLIASAGALGQSSKKINKRKPQTKEISPNVGANYGKYNFSFRTLDGKALKLSDYAGKIVLVNIWAPWCSPCKMETPGFVRLYEKYYLKGFEIIGIAVQTNESDVRAFMEKCKVRWQVGIKNEIAKAYGTYGIPDSYLFRLDGALIKEFVGYASEEALEPLIKEALKSVR